MLEAGVPIESIAKMMGHSSIASTQVYAQVTDQKIAKNMERVMQKTLECALESLIFHIFASVLHLPLTGNCDCDTPSTTNFTLIEIWLKMKCMSYMLT